MSNLEIVLFDTNQEALDGLKTACEDLSVITVKNVERVLYTHPPSGIDAIVLVLPAAEKWGAKPILEAQVLNTSPDDQRSGMPRYVVAGGVLRREDTRDPVQDATMVIGTALDAVRKFNATNREGAIHRLGFWAVNLTGVTPEQLSAIFTRAL